MSSENAAIYKAFVKAQSQFGAALKTSTNPHFRSRYADLASCIEAVIDALNANGIALTQYTTECETGVIVETIFLHESGEIICSGKLYVPATKHDAQGYGSALTYARRYSLMSAFGLAPIDDDGMAASTNQQFLMPEKELADHLANIEASTDGLSLKTAYFAAYEAAHTDLIAQKKIIAAKDKQKKSLGSK